MTPKFYSKFAIGGWTLLFTPLFGCILFSYNLREVGKLKESRLILIAGFIWPILINFITKPILSNALLQMIVSNIIGSALLTFYCWDKYLIDFQNYETRKIWKPVVIMFLIFFTLFGLVMLIQK